MRFPSVREALGRARKSAERFPLALAAGVVAAVAACLAMGAEEDQTQYLRATLAALAGLPLVLVVALAAERWRPGRRGVWLAGAAAVAVPVWFFFQSSGWSLTLLFTRFFHLAAGLHLAVAFLPFVGLSGENGFWQYNRTLFLRFLLAALYSAVLFAGLALALVALDQLFGVDVEGETYPRLFFVIAFVFNTWFFVAGVPADLAALEEQRDYPAGLRVFTQFVLMPLVGIYLLILTAYLGRVLITRMWPSGWIGWLVSSVAVAGTLALLLVHPLREREGHGWINAYGRWFFVLLLPSVGMLLAAIVRRVGQYGFTERRYFLLVLALYLAGIAIWYAATGSRRIRLIPLILSLVAFATLAGPWSAYAVSRRSQLARFTSALARHGMLVDGVARRATAEVPLEDRGRMSGALEYLIETHGTTSIAAVVGSELAGEPQRGPGRFAADRAAAVMSGLGLDYVSRWQAGGERQLHFTAQTDSLALGVSGYAYLLETDLVRPSTVRVGQDTITLSMDTVTLVVTLSRNGREALRLDLASEMARLSEAGGGFGVPLPPERLVFEAAGEGSAARVLLRILSGTESAGRYRVRLAQALVLLRFD
jgi:hypothetical protein